MFPILHFIVFGIIVYFLYTLLKPTTTETIYITTQTIDALIQQRESIMQNPVSDEEKEDIIIAHIEDEILLREAYKRGLNENDYRVRKRLLNMMRTSLSEVIPEPSNAQLRAYYDENIEKYQTSPSLSFKHIYFSFVNMAQPQEPEKYIQQLKVTPDVSKFGEYFPMGKVFVKSPFSMVASNFGKPFAEYLFKLPLNKWSGPAESIHGIHYVIVTEHHEAQTPPFENIESYLRDDYFLQKSREVQQRKIDELRKNYEIIVEGKTK
jgi:hypothetical protein